MRAWLTCLWRGHIWGKEKVTYQSYMLYDKWHGCVIGYGKDRICCRNCERCGAVRKMVSDVEEAE